MMSDIETQADTTQEGSDQEQDARRGREGLPALVLAHAPDARAPEVRFLPPKPISLGRGCELFDSGPLVDGKMSREHAQLTRDDALWTLTDMGSRNGTFVDGKRIEGPTRLQLGAVLRVGDTLLVFARCAQQRSGRSPLVGESAQMGAIRTAIQSVAKGATSVLVTGETGTGKEMVAQELHEQSGRRGRLVSINCGAIPEGLLASELFGHSKGAFTGATDARDGLFRAADGGTLFLDEVGEMPLSLQVQLLRLLETKSVRPVGSTRDIPVDVRIVAATNRDLPTAIQKSSFRPDLYVRLAQWQVRLPPLRERRADIPFLARALLARRGAGGRAMTTELAQTLLLHSWPFNVRGLLNILTAADIESPREGPLTLCPEVQQTLDTEHEIAGVAASTSTAPPTSPRNAPPRAAPPRTTVVSALDAACGSISNAARQLGCSRQQLYRWIAAYGIEVPRPRRG